MTFYENSESQGREDIRVKVDQYLEKLASAGHRDVEETCLLWLSLSAYASRRSRPPLFKLLRTLDQRC